MRADPEEVAEAKAEGVKFVFEHKPVEIVGIDGTVTKLVCDAGEVECDSVIAAIGQTVDFGGLDLGAIEKNEKGCAVADGLTYQTAQKDIFAGGDVYTGPKFAIDAISAGKQAAISIHRFVQEGQDLTLWRGSEFRALDKDAVAFDTLSYDDAARQRPASTRKTDFTDSRCTFTEEQLKKETARCLGCGASVVDQNKCLGCGVCTTRCKFDAIHLIKRTNTESIPYTERPKILPQFISDRQEKIRIRKLTDK